MTAPQNDRHPPVGAMLDLAEAVADINRLLVMDGAWTGAENRGEFVARDRDRLIALGNRVDAELAAIGPHVATLRKAFETFPGWINARIAEGLATERFTPSQREGLAQKLAVEGGDFAVRGIALADAVMDQVPREREELKKKIEALRGEGPIATDIDPALACGVGALASMGALAAGVALESVTLIEAGAVGLAVVFIAC
jgi:hypothetical protein